MPTAAIVHRLDHQEQCPRHKESPITAQAPRVQVDILASGLRHHGGECRRTLMRADRMVIAAVTMPRRDQQRRRSERARHISRHNKDARSDHGSHDDGCRREQTHALDKAWQRPIGSAQPLELTEYSPSVSSTVKVSEKVSCSQFDQRIPPGTLSRPPMTATSRPRASTDEPGILARKATYCRPAAW